MAFMRVSLIKGYIRWMPYVTERSLRNRTYTDPGGRGQFLT